MIVQAMTVQKKGTIRMLQSANNLNYKARKL
jgi:hypothetical protein